MKEMKHWLMQEILINNSSEHNIIQEVVISVVWKMKMDMRCSLLRVNSIAVHFATCFTLKLIPRSSNSIKPWNTIMNIKWILIFFVWDFEIFFPCFFGAHWFFFISLVEVVFSTALLALKKNSHLITFYGCRKPYTHLTNLWKDFWYYFVVYWCCWWRPDKRKLRIWVRKKLH